MQLIQYKQLFLTEASTKLKGLEDALVTLEKHAGDMSSIDKALQALHALKGDAATMNFHRFSNAVHQVEELFIEAKQGRRELSNEDIDNVFMVIDAFRTNLESIRASNIEIDLGPATAFLLRERPTSKQKKATSKPSAMSVDAAPSSDLYAPLSSFVEVSAPQLEKVLDMANDIVASQQQLQRLLKKGDLGGVQVGLYNLASTASDLRQHIVSVKMIPVKQYFVFLARLVRDLAREQKKFITFAFKDNNLRFEGHILESLREVCVQLIKNAVDHGFREGEHGTVTLLFEFKAGKMYLSVSDTGHGIDWAGLERAALAQKSVSRNALAKADSQGKQSLLLAAGVSSRSQVSLTSGRGVGLPLVRTIVGQLQGSLTFESRERGTKRGTRFEVAIPLTPTLFRAITWRWGSYYLALPLFVIEKVIQLPKGKRIAHSSVYRYRSSEISVANLAERLGLISYDTVSSEPDAVAIVKWNEERCAVVVPAGLKEQELIITTVPSLARFPALAGAAISEDSIPVMIINHRVLFKKQP